MPLPSRATVPAAGYLFVDDVEVVRMVAAICPIAALYQFPDGILGCIGGLIEYMNNGHLSTLLMVLGRSGMVIGVIGGIIAFMGLFGMTGALV